MNRLVWTLWPSVIGPLMLAACGPSEGGAPPAWFAEVERPLPVWLSATGIYDALPELEESAAFEAYAPAHPLWSNGAQKRRLIHLPPGAVIDASDSTAWAFPVGSVLIKTFTLEDVERRSGPVAIETRLLVRRAAGWLFAVYIWNQAGTDARRLEGRWTPQPLVLVDAEGDDLEYTVPGVLDCEACHETSATGHAIGVSWLQFDPRLLDPALVAPAPTDSPSRLGGRSPAEEGALGWFVGNCVHCHHGGATGENASFSLLPDRAVANTVGVATASSATGDGIRIVPGQPEASALFRAVVESEGPFRPMPPVGIDRIDPDAEPLLRDWIDGL